MDKTSIFKLIFPFLIGAVIWLLPHPSGIEVAGWHLLAIFIATIFGIILRPLPMGAIALMGIMVAAASGTVSIGEALSGFGNKVIWLIVSAFMLSRGFIKTGLGRRIAYRFMKVLGRTSLGLAYGFAISDLVLAPAIPSNTARSGGVIFPILRSTAQVYGSSPDDGTQKKIGHFLILASFQAQIITSAMFMTAMAANPLSVELASQLGAKISWVQWAVAASLPGLFSLLVIPFLIYKMSPPEIRETPDARAIAVRELEQMGRMKREEWILFGVFGLLLILWIFGRFLNIHSTTAAFIGLSILIIFGVLDWDDILREKGAWDTLVWFAALVMMATYLNKYGLIPWFSNQMAQMFSGFSWQTAFLLLSLIYFYSHYFFASNTAHVSSMFAPFLAASIAVGAPPVFAALILAFFSNLFSSTTHYGTGPSPIFFGSGYVDLKQWWKVGFLISIVNILIWLGFGGIWLKMLNFW